MRDARGHLHDAMQGLVGLPAPGDADGDPLPDGSLLLGWVVVAEWMSPDGKRGLTKVDGGGVNGERLPFWQAEGYLHAALRYDWSSGDDA